MKQDIYYKIVETLARRSLVNKTEFEVRLIDRYTDHQGVELKLIAVKHPRSYIAAKEDTREYNDPIRLTMTRVYTHTELTQIRAQEAIIQRVNNLFDDFIRECWNY